MLGALPQSGGDGRHRRLGVGAGPERSEAVRRASSAEAEAAWAAGKCCAIVSLGCWMDPESPLLWEYSAFVELLWHTHSGRVLEWWC